MDIHLFTPRGAELVVQVVDSQVIVPSAPAREPDPAERESATKIQA